MKSQHTRGIWKTDGELDNIRIHTGEKNKGYHRIALISGNAYLPPNYEEVEDNAKRIVHCVNNHDDLLQALQGIITAFWNEEPKGFHQRRGSYYDSIKESYAQKIEAAEKAIEAAE